MAAITSANGTNAAASANSTNAAGSAAPATAVASLGEDDWRREGEDFVSGNKDYIEAVMARDSGAGVYPERAPERSPHQLIGIVDLDLFMSLMSISSRKDARLCYQDKLKELGISPKQAYRYHRKVREEFLEPLEELASKGELLLFIVTRNSLDNANWELEVLFGMTLEHVHIIAFPDKTVSKTALVHWRVGIQENDVLIMGEDSREELNLAENFLQQLFPTTVAVLPVRFHRILAKRVPRGEPYREYDGTNFGQGIGNQPEVMKAFVDAARWHAAEYAKEPEKKKKKEV